jgi:hypothetical protein
VTRIVADESLDLYLLAAAALIFTVLGVTGLASVKDLASMILALLAVLALSQIRSRHHVAAIARSQNVGPLALLATDFPADLIKRRARASSLLMVGTSMSRTVQGANREDLRGILSRGGQIRALLLDPSNDELLQAISGPNLNPERLKARILGTLGELSDLRNSTGGRLEIRVSSFPPMMSIGVIDADGPDGLLITQHKEYKPSGEAAPIICLNRKDGFWFSHFLAEAERLWDDGTPWPLSPSHALAQVPPSAFRGDHGPN